MIKLKQIRSVIQLRSGWVQGVNELQEKLNWLRVLILSPSWNDFWLDFTDLLNDL